MSKIPKAMKQLATFRMVMHMVLAFAMAVVAIVGAGTFHNALFGLLIIFIIGNVWLSFMYAGMRKKIDGGGGVEPPWAPPNWLDRIMK